MKKVMFVLAVVGFCGISLGDILKQYDMESDTVAGAGWTWSWGGDAAGNVIIHTSNGPSLPGTRCLQMYPTAGSGTGYGNIYTWYGFTAAQTAADYKEFTIQFDQRVVNTAQFIYWSIDMLFTDSTHQIVNTTPVKYQADWGTFTVEADVSAENMSKTVKGMTLYYYHPNILPNAWTRLDNVVLSGVVPEPATLGLLGLGGVGVFLRKRRQKKSA